VKITVKRFIHDKTTTISRVYIDDEFECFGLEDEPRDIKAPGETRIPAGLYRVGIKDFGPHHEKYAARFPDIHIGMLIILNVPGFTDVLIHILNNEKETDGCFGVGTTANLQPGQMSIQNSARAYIHLYSTVALRAKRGELTIEFIDNDNPKEE